MGSEKKAEPRNKDLPVLQNVLAVMQDVCNGENQIEWLHDRMYFITQRFSQTPGVGGQPMGFDVILADIDDLGDSHRRRIKACVRELRKAERILNDIPNQTMRTFVTMLYVMKFTPAQVKNELGLSEWKFRTAREEIEHAKLMKNVRWSLETQGEEPIL